jgi:hypothetical protein
MDALPIEISAIVPAPGPISNCPTVMTETVGS